MLKFCKNLSFVFVCNLIVLVFVSCPLDPTPINYKWWGVSISKYEKWMTPKVEDLEAKYLKSNLYLDSLYGYSDWMDWKSADGDKLRPYIDVNEISKDFSGKFRVLAYQQKFLVGFNDENFTTVSFYNYCGLTDEVLKREDGKTFRGKMLTKVTDDIYMYVANFIKYPDRKPLYYFEDHKKGTNAALVFIERLPNRDSDFHYTIKIGNNDVFNGVLHSLAPSTITLDNPPEWFPSRFKEITCLTSEPTSSFYYGDMSFSLAENKIDAAKGKGFSYRFTLTNNGAPVLFFADGIENPTFDEANQALKFYLKGRKEYETVDYVVCKVLNEVPIGQSNNLPPGFVNSARKGTLTFYKENPNGDDIIVKHFDENHTEFSVIGLVKNELTV